MSAKNRPRDGGIAGARSRAGEDHTLSSSTVAEPPDSRRDALPHPDDGGDCGHWEDYDPNQLQVLDRDKLTECETVIERGLATFHEVGRALLDIRDLRLYRETHPRFEDYLRERWGIDRTYAHRLIQSAKVVETLPVGNTPTSEAQSRELVPLLMAGRPAEVRRVWAEANERTGNNPTATTIREVREELRAAASPQSLPDDRQGAKPRPRRHSLPDSYWNAVYRLEKAVESLARLHTDDRFLHHRDDLKQRSWRTVSAAAALLDSIDNDLGGYLRCRDCGQRIPVNKEFQSKCEECA